jgi:hypothetical protein
VSGFEPGGQSDVRKSVTISVGWAKYDSLRWEPVKFVDGLQAVGELHERYPRKPGRLEACGVPRTSWGETVTAQLATDDRRSTKEW